MTHLPPFLRRLNVGVDADERSIRRAYARELKLIDQEADPAGFQSLREAYEAALIWLRYRDAQAAEQGAAPAPATESASDPAPVVSYAPAVVITPVANPAPETQDPMPEPVQQPAQENHYAREQAQAREVFEEFLQHCQGIGHDCGVTDDAPWQRELRRSLAEERLLNITACHIFEWHVACLLADGWQPGHQALLVAAVKVFGWGRDRRRVQSLGEAGSVLDQAIEQRTMFDMQPGPQQIRQRQLIERLRNPAQPSARELVRDSDQLEQMIARFPTWLALVTSVPHIHQWRQMNGDLPGWRRKLTFTGLRKPAEPSYEKQPRSGINWGWLVFVAIMSLGRIFSHSSDSSSTPSYQEQPRESPNTYRAHGERALREHDYSEAVAAFTHALQLSPRNAEDYYQRALAYEGDHQPDMALEDAAQSIKLYPDMGPGAYELRARIFNTLGEKEKAIAEMQALRAALPDARPSALGQFQFRQVDNSAHCGLSPDNWTKLDPAARRMAGCGN